VAAVRGKLMNRHPTQAPGLRILVVDQDAADRTQLMLGLEADGHHVVGHGNIYDAQAEASWHAFDLVFVDLRSGNGERAGGKDVIARLRDESPGTRVIVIGAHDSPLDGLRGDALTASRGAADYLAKPFTTAQVQSLTRRVAELRL